MKIDPQLADILKKYGATPDTDIWNCHGVWVAYHKTLERIAVQAGISFEPPTIVRANDDEAVICVTGHMNDRSEWSFGEAKIGLNYKVSSKQAGYPYAMAEKRAKDRVILKLVGLSGYVYSEEEADDFKDPSKMSKANSRDVYARLQRELRDIPKTQQDPGAVKVWWDANKPALDALTDDWYETLKAEAENIRADMRMAMGNAA